MSTIVTNKDAADILFNVATILEMAEDNPYRVRAYRRAAQLLLGNPNDARVMLVDGKHGKELDLPGIGQRLRRKLGELIATGRMRFYVDLCADLPDEVAGLMALANVGPKTALRLHEELGLATAADVYEAAQSGKIRQLYGFGEKRELQLLAAAEAVLAGSVRSFVPRPVEPVPVPPTPIALPALPEAA
jgi:DNA polymerase (family 10)